MDKPITPERPPYTGPETYKGVPVPETLRPNWNDKRVEVFWWKCGVDSATETDMITRYDSEFAKEMSLYDVGFHAQLDELAPLPCPCGSGVPAVSCPCIVDMWPVGSTDG